MTDVQSLAVERAKSELEFRMRHTGIEYKPEQIGVFEHDGRVYVLCNPLLKEEVKYTNPDGKEIILEQRTYNITAVWEDRPMPPKIDFQATACIVSLDAPRIVILRPDLCARIEPDGDVVMSDVVGSRLAIEHQFTDVEKQIERRVLESLSDVLLR